MTLLIPEKVYIGMTPEKFSNICHLYLDAFGSRLTHTATPALAVVRTPEGNYYIKYTSILFSISTANYGEGFNPRFIYLMPRDAQTHSAWLPDEAAKLLPHIKKALVLDLLADACA